MLLRRLSSVLLALTVVPAAFGHGLGQGTTKELKPSELPDFRIHHWGHYPSKDSPTSGNEIKNLFVAFDNDSPYEVASVDVRFTATKDDKVVFKSGPMRISRFNDYYFRNPNGAVPGHQTFSLDLIQIDRPKKDWESDDDASFEIVSVRIYRGRQDLHDLGHLYTWLRTAPEKEVLEAVKKDPSIATSVNGTQFTALSVVYSMASLKVVKAMVEAAGFGAPALPFKMTPMHMAASNPHLDVLEYVLSRGGDPEAKADGDQTPLLFALFNKNLAGARWLIRHGANPDRPSRDIYPVSYAMSYGSTDAVDLLIQEGAKFRDHNKDGYGWMHLAVSRNDVDTSIFELLVKRGLSVNDVDPRLGVTPLMAAAKAHKARAASWLLEHGAKPNLIDNKGQDAFAYARMNGGPEGDQWLRRLVNRGS